MAKSEKGPVFAKLYEKHAGTKRETIPDGKYVCQFRNLSLQVDGDEPKARLNGTIVRGDAKGMSVTKFYSFYDRTTKNGTELSGETEVVRFMEDLAILGIDTAEVEYDELESVVKDDKPQAQISVKSNGDYINVSIIAPVDSEDDEDEDDEEVEVDDEDEEEEEDEPVKPTKKAPAKKPTSKVEEEEEEEEEDEDGDDEEEDDEPSLPEKGQSCLHKAKGMKKPSVFTIKSVNKTKKTVDLVHDATGKAYPGVAWSEIEIDDEE